MTAAVLTTTSYQTRPNGSAELSAPLGYSEDSQLCVVRSATCHSPATENLRSFGPAAVARRKLQQVLWRSTAPLKAVKSKTRVGLPQDRPRDTAGPRCHWRPRKGSGVPRDGRCGTTQQVSVAHPRSTIMAPLLQQSEAQVPRVFRAPLRQQTGGVRQPHWPACLPDQSHAPKWRQRAGVSC